MIRFDKSAFRRLLALLVSLFLLTGSLALADEPVVPDVPAEELLTAAPAEGETVSSPEEAEETDPDEETEEVPDPEEEPDKESVPEQLPEEKEPAEDAEQISEGGEEENPADESEKEEQEDPAEDPAEETEDLGEQEEQVPETDPEETEIPEEITDPEADPNAESAPESVPEIPETPESPSDLPLQNALPETADPEETTEETNPEVLSENGDPEGTDLLADTGNRNLPTSYNAYEEGLLPALRNQGSEGACWAFAAIGAIEVDLIHDELADPDIDVSELYLTYYATHLYEPTKGDNGDTITYSGLNWLNFGGYDLMAIRTLANQMGPTVESEAEYEEGASFTPYSDTPNVYQMTGAYLISGTDQTAIKQAILDHGSVMTGMYSKQSLYYKAQKADGSGNAYYSNDWNKANNHAVMIVGWDDDFSRENFKDGKQPSQNGAWLVRNSWWDPDAEHDYGDEYEYSGYFWISYEDAGIRRGNVTAFDADDYLYASVYAHDQTIAPEGYYTLDKKEATVSQTFVMEADEVIEAVGFETDNDNVQADITLVANGQTATASLLTGSLGFYLVKLNQPLAVESQTEVTLSIHLAASEYLTILCEIPEQEVIRGTDGTMTWNPQCDGFQIDGEDYSGDARMKLYTRSVAPTSVSVPSSLTLQGTSSAALSATVLPEDATTKWVSWSSSNTSVATVDRNGKVTACGVGKCTVTATTVNGLTANCQVKVTEVKPASITLDPTSLTLATNTSGQLRATVLPENAIDKSVTWSSTDKSVATVDQSGNVKAVAVGQCTIKAKTVNGLTATCLVTVTYPHPSSVALSAASLTIDEGGTASLTATVSPANAADRSVSWSSSNTAVATVDAGGKVKGLHDGTAVITVRTNDGGLTATCTVTVQTKDPVEAFVYRMYRICLLREPDGAGFRNWVTWLKNGDKTGAEVAYGFYNSPEMINRHLSNEEYVTRAYQGIMGRNPDPAGKGNWVAFLDQGVSYAYIISGFTRSQEFTNLCAKYGIKRGYYYSTQLRDQKPGITGYVSRLYLKALQRGYDLHGLNTWVGKILEDPSKEMMVYVATTGFLHSKEFLGKNLSDEEYVKVLYRTFLNREFDGQGLNTWTGNLKKGMSRDEVAMNFANSKEFKNMLANWLK